MQSSQFCSDSAPPNEIPAARGVAVECCRRALECSRRQDFAAAVAWYDLALDDGAKSPQLHFALADALMGLAKSRSFDTEDMIACLDRAANHLQRALDLRPEFPSAHLRLACLRLLRGDLASGFHHFEWRFQAELLLRPGDSATPLWAGEPLAGATILLHAEQGLGDTMHFVRYAPLVAERGGHVVVAAPERLHRLLNTAPAVDQVIAPGSICEPAKWQCSLMSLPAILHTRPETVPARVPYLMADSRQVSAWRASLPANTLNVGIVWAGCPTRDSDRYRSMPLSMLEPLTRVEGLSLFSLQRGAGSEQLRSEMGGRIQDLEQTCHDMADTAAIIMALDLVVSVDTSIAHLAGALGKPVWLMLSHLPDWRWQLRRTDSPWYPTARLFRQGLPGDWLGLATAIAGELRNMTRQKSLRRAQPV